MKGFETGDCKKRRKDDFYTHALYSEYATDQTDLHDVGFGVMANGHF